MTTAINEKKSVIVISVIAWGLALFFTTKLASAETKMANQDTTVGWYETEDALTGMHHHNADKMMKRSENSNVIPGNNLVYSWYETEDALPYSGMQKSQAMAQKSPVERQANTVEDLDNFSWIDTEDALPKRS